MTGLTISAVVVGILLLGGGVALVFCGDRFATRLNDRRRLLDGPPRRKASAVLFRGVGVFVFVGGLIVTQLSVGILLFD